MYKENPVINGLYRLLTVVLVFVFLYGEILIIGQTKAHDAVVSTWYTLPAKPFDIKGFILLNVGWLVVLYLVTILVIFIINGFRTKVKTDKDHRKNLSE